jgi:hypothetical protein
MLLEVLWNAMNWSIQMERVEYFNVRIAVLITGHE